MARSGGWDLGTSSCWRILRARATLRRTSVTGTLCSSWSPSPRSDQKPKSGSTAAILRFCGISSFIHYFHAPHKPKNAGTGTPLVRSDVSAGWEIHELLRIDNQPSLLKKNILVGATPTPNCDSCHQNYGAYGCIRKRGGFCLTLFFECHLPITSRLGVIWVERNRPVIRGNSF
jgi:hypothetical protein